MIFASPSETQSGLRCPTSEVRSSPDLSARRLASVRIPDSSHGVVKYRPSIDMGAWCPLPVSPPLRRAVAYIFPRESACDAVPPSARGCHIPDTFRPCRFSRLRRFAPPGTLQVYCTLLPILGFAMFLVLGVVLRDLTTPSAEAGERSRLGVAVRLHPEGAAFWLPSSDLSVSLTRPRGAARASRRGSHPFLLDLSQWRSTLRSFPLVSSCAASTVLFSRTPRTRPFAGGPGLGVVSGALFDLMARATAVIAFSPLFPVSSRPASIQRKRWMCS